MVKPMAEQPSRMASSTLAVIAWVVYWKLGLKVLRQGWVNFDLIWSVALIAVGGIALVAAA